MSALAARLKRHLIALALRLLARYVREEKKELVGAIVFKGKTIPLKDIEAVAAAIAATAGGIQSGKSEKEIFAMVAPLLVDVGADVASMFIPGAGAAIEVIAFIIQHSKKLSQEEENKWFDRFGAGSQS